MEHQYIFQAIVEATITYKSVLLLQLLHKQRSQKKWYKFFYKHNTVFWRTAKYTTMQTFYRTAINSMTMVF